MMLDERYAHCNTSGSSELLIDNHHDGNNGNYDWSCGQDNYIVMFDGKRRT